LRSLFIAGLLLGCTGKAEEECSTTAFSYALDDQLAFQHLQAKGSHNSYHIETTGGMVPEWEYTHAPIETQLATQGVRQLELDLHYNSHQGSLEVLHVPTLDPGTTCESLLACVEDIAAFSEANPAHHPLLILLEFKSKFEEEEASHWLSRADSVLETLLGPEKLVLPDEVQGAHPDLKTAIESDGWPTLGALRGKSLFVLHHSGALRDLYTENGTTTEGRMMFPDAGGDRSLPFAAVHSQNDPFASADNIASLVTNNHLVRTRTDADQEEARAEDNSRLLAALDSGAHFLSTDYPVPVDGFEYWVQIPGGTPSRCNPVTAPNDCRSEDIEDPAFLGPCD